MNFDRKFSDGNNGDNTNFVYTMPHERLSLKREDIRLRTYDENFTAAFISPLSLAKAGFFYVGIDDQVQCAFCKGVVRDWERNDDPKQEHQRLFPSCPFMLGLPVGNIPLGEDPPARSTVERSVSLPVNQQHLGGYGDVRNFTPQLRPNASPDTEIHSPSSIQLNALVGDNLEELGITKHAGPRYSTYSTLESRIRSFTQWPTHLKQSPHAMAQAGFFHLGTNDHVNCFHCGSGLRNWEPDDDPWLEHARWFPQCRFVMLMKGEQYIKAVAESMSPPKAKASGSVEHRRYAPREVTEAELWSLLGSPVAQTVLGMGVDLSRVKQAIQRQIRTTGQPFNSVDSLLEAAIEIQQHSEHRQALEDPTYETVDWESFLPLPAHLSENRRSPARLNREERGHDNLRTLLDEGTHNACSNQSGTSSQNSQSPNQPEHHDTSSVSGKPKEPTELIYAPQGADRTQMLEEEIRRLKEARLCKVCLDEEVSIAYIPCGHIVTCVQCAAALEHCPLCRKNIKGTVRIFLS